MTFTMRLAATAALAALAAVPPSYALAQTDDSPGMEEAPIPDALLESFVVAALEVSEVAESYEGRIEAAETQESRDTLTREAREAMVSAVEDTDGITVDEYVAITQAAQVDQALNRRVMDLLAERAPAQ